MLLAASALAASAATIEPEVGLAQTQLSDVHQSPLPYSAVGFRPGLRVTAGQRVRVFGRLAATLGSARAISPRPSLGAEWTEASFTLGTDVAVGSTDRTTLRIGAAASKRIEIIDGMAGHIWGLGTGALAAHARVEHRVGSVTVALDVDVPVVAAITRHNWSLDPVVPGLGDVPAFYKVGTRLAAIGQFLDVRARGELAVPLGKRHAWQLGLAAAYFAYPEPRPVRRLDLSVVTGPRFVLGGA